MDGDMINIHHNVAMLTRILAVELKPGVLLGAISKNGVLGPFMHDSNVC
jgi:hypothetical protein